MMKLSKSDKQYVSKARSVKGKKNGVVPFLFEPKRMTKLWYDKQERLGKEFEEVLYDNLWELYEK